jgi:hypothetical protein
VDLQIKGQEFTWKNRSTVVESLSSKAITFDPDVQIEKTRARWKARDMKNNLEMVSMVGMIAIMP